MEYLKDDNGMEWEITPNGDKVRVFAIPQPNMGKFEERLSKLVKRALKLGVEAPSWRMVREEHKVLQVRTDREDEDGKPVMEEKLLLINHITVQHPKVVVADNEFVAMMEHTEEGNIIHSLPGKSVPAGYRDSIAYCDHCQVHRRRNNTFIVRHITDGNYKQIGRNCLADYLGRDAERYASAAELYYTVDELASASEMGDYEGGMGGGEQYDMLDSYLSYVAEVIAHVGWLSRSAAKERDGAQATADIAIFHMHPPMGVRRSDFLFTYPTEASKETAKAAIAWCEELSDEEVKDSDYLHNIRVIARRGVVGYRQVGYAASIVSAYQRHLGELKLKERQMLHPSQYVGEEGERRLFHLLVEKVLTSEGPFGATAFHIMSDKDGNVFIWRSTGEVLKAGEEYDLRGSIKRHQEYNGKKQTVLTRCEEVEMVYYNCVVAGQLHTVWADSEKGARKLLLGKLDITRLPKGTLIMPQLPTDGCL